MRVEKSNATNVKMGDSIDSFTGEQMQVIAQGLSGLYPLTPDVADALAADTEYFVREVLQLALSFQAHTKETSLSPMHVASALRIIAGRTPLGYGSSFPSHVLPFKAVPLCDGLYVPADKVVSLETIRDAPLPKKPPANPPRTKWLRPPAACSNDMSLGKAIAAANALSMSTANETDDEDPDDDVDQVDNGRKKQSPPANTLVGAVSSLMNTVQDNLRTDGDAGVLSKVLEIVLLIATDTAQSVRSCAHDLVRLILSILLAPDGPGDAERRLAAATLARVLYIFEDVSQLRSRALRTVVMNLTKPISDESPLEVTYGAVLGVAALGSDAVRLFLTPSMPNLSTSLSNALSNAQAIPDDRSERVAQLVANISESIAYACADPTPHSTDGRRNTKKSKF